MNEHMKRAFATNLRKARQIKKLTQDKAASMIPIKRATYQAYEEDRAEPSMSVLIRIAEILDIDNLTGFISDPDFNPKAQEKTRAVCMKSPLQSNFVRSITIS